MIFLFNENEELQRVLDQSSEVWNVEINENIEGLFNFQFTISGENEIAKEIDSSWLVGIKDIDGKGQLFLITEIEENHEEDLEKTIYCEHSVIELMDTVVEDTFVPASVDSVALERILGHTNGRWEMGTVEDGADTHQYTIKYTNLLEVLKTFSERWGNELAFEIEFTGTGIGRRLVHCYQQRGSETGKRFDFDKDLESVRRTMDTSHIKTALYGTATSDRGEEGVERTTFENVEWITEDITNILPVEFASAEIIQDLKVYSGAGNQHLLVIDDNDFIEGSASIRADWKETETFSAIYHSTYLTDIVGGQPYTFSVYSKTTNTDVTWRPRIYFYDVNNNKIDDIFPAYVPSSKNWTRLFISGVAPSNATKYRVEIDFENTYDGFSAWWDKGQMEQNDAPTIWTEGGTTRKANPMNKPFGQSFLADENARLKWGRVQNGTRVHRFGVFDYGGELSDEELIEETWGQLQTVKDPLIQYEVKAVDLNRLTGLNPLEVRLGDVVYIIDKDLDLKVKARVIERTGDLFDPELFEYKLGNFLPFLSRKIDQLNFAVNRTREIAENKISRGEVIKIDWFEREIELLNSYIRTGQGTVTITENNGILITDKKDNPTKALRLLGGAFAISNTKNPDGTWDWSTFGTGDGFSARHINTETMRFDRIQGGKLKLGGAIDGYYENGQPIFQNGILEVFDEEGNLAVELTGANRGFDKLHVNELSAPNVITKTDNVGQNKWYYIDVLTGSDGNDGSIDTPFRTMQGALENIPQYFTDDVYIKVVNTDTQWKENVEIRGFSGKGRLIIYFGYRNTLQGNVFLEHCSCTVWLTTDGSVSDHDNRAYIDGWDSTTAVVRADACSYVMVYGIKIGAPSWLSAGNSCSYVTANYYGYMRVQNSEIHDVSYACISALYGGKTMIYQVSGLATYSLRPYLAEMYVGSYIPSGETATVNNYASAVYGDTTSTTAGVKTEPPPPRATNNFSPTQTHSYRDYDNGWADDWRTEDTLYQGEYEYYGNHRGILLFDRTAIVNALKNPDGTKRTVVQARLRLTRISSGGSSAKQYPTFWTTTATSIGGTAPSPPLYNSWKSDVGWAWGDTLWVNLPPSMIDAIYNGHTGLGTYTANRSPYMRWNGATYDYEPSRPLLEITHE